MKKTTKLLTILLVATTLSSCGTTTPSDIISNENSNDNSLESYLSSESESSIVESSSVDDTVYSKFIDIDEEIYVEEFERYSLANVLRNYKDIKVASKNVNTASYYAAKHQILGKKIGKVDFVLSYQGQNQKLVVNVVESGTFATDFPFDYARLESKTLAAFGDSVTADATLHGTGKTYVTLFAEKFGMDLIKNYAIGGTTATYMYPGSNIYKEYYNNANALDGCRVVKKALDSGEIDGLDYAFIAFGHNDQYFQPPITAPNDTIGYGDGSFTSCYSFKGSYRYMIDALREANENIRIILLNCTYSEYDLATANSSYGHAITYSDYRNAIREIAIEKNCRYVDPWDYLKPYCDYLTNKVYYGDCVHLTANGHKLLSEYIYKN